jgi:hypothetical protein
MSDEEIEQFEISDYDYKSAMNPGVKRNRQSKEQATYGIWSVKEYDSDDEEADDGEGFRNKRRNKSATDGIRFVSGGIKGAKKQTKDDDEDNDDEEKKEDVSLFRFRLSKDR